MSATTQSATAVVVPPRLGDPYQPRPVRFIRLEPRGDWRLKVYGIATPGRTPRPELVTAAMDMAPAVLPAPAAGDERYGVGIVLVHDSATYCFALYTVAVRERAAPARTRQRGGSPSAGQPAHPAAGCVGASPSSTPERSAWLEDVEKPRGPTWRHLSRRFSAEVQTPRPAPASELPDAANWTG
jgi:hypothetical protein